jgi:hypothetical protein
MVLMKCMTLKKTFECEDPEVVLLKNNRYAYKAMCPWKGKHGNDLFAFKFASSQAYRDYMQKSCKDEHSDDSGNSEHSESE